MSPLSLPNHINNLEFVISYFIDILDLNIDIANFTRNKEIVQSFYVKVRLSYDAKRRKNSISHMLKKHVILLKLCNIYIIM